MRLKKASGKAIRYACLKFHYAKAVPQIRLGYSVFNDQDEWCGVVLFSNGANPRIAQEYSLVQGEVIELVRVALNGKQSCTSQILGAALRELKKDAPLVKIIVSYADRNQDHIGVIYQATNWLYMDERSNEMGIRINGKLVHRRSVASKYGNASMEWIRANVDVNAQIVRGLTKIKYVFPMNKWERKRLTKIAKPYPKKELQTAG